MSDYFVYLMKAGIALAVFWAVYILFLRKETFFQLNRMFLIIAMVSAFIIPLVRCSCSWFTNGLAKFPWLSRLWYPSTGMDIDPVKASGPLETVHSPDIMIVILIIYLIGAAVLTLRFIYHILSVLSMVQHHHTVRSKGYCLVWTRQDLSPFSFFHYIFINKDSILKKDFQKIIAHELVHVRQWHTLDLFLSEMIIILQWMNPFVWPYKSYLKETHEYLADAGVIAQGCDVSAYQMLMVEQSVGGKLFGFSNSFHHTQMKRRIKMMFKDPSHKEDKMKLLLIVPVFLLMVISFTSIGELNAGALAPALTPGLENSPVTSGEEPVASQSAEVDEKELKKEQEKAEKNESLEEKEKETALKKAEMKEKAFEKEKELARLEMHLKELKVEMQKLDAKNTALLKKKESLEEDEASQKALKKKMMAIKEKMSVVQKEANIVQKKMQIVKTQAD